MRQRAERNRTLYIEEGERDNLLRGVLSAQDVRSGSNLIDKTICANLMEIIDSLPSNFADLLVIDPPYNLSKNYNGLKFQQTSDEEYIDYVESWLPKILKTLKPNGSIYICCDWKSTSAIYRTLSKHAVVINRITWQREKGRGASKNWKNCMEDIWFAVLDDKNYYFDLEAVKQKRKVIAPYRENGKPKDWEASEQGNYRLTCPSNFWDDITVPFWSMPENTDHPTQKPEKLIAKLILSSCPVGGVVFDPFLGSGTTSVVAKKLRRHYCGVEISENYCCLAEKRLALADNNKNIQGYYNGVFWERNTLNEQSVKRNKYQTVDNLSLFAATSM
ncbi:MAG: site-specific DNA-methyltransferase [Paludibacteraceae bacterium]|nr:site-specific DNA-methyltransferase [Paludibacteraceae bacterium]